MNIPQIKFYVCLVLFLQSCDDQNDKAIKANNTDNTNNDTVNVIEKDLIKLFNFYTKDSILTKVINFDGENFFDFKTYRYPDEGEVLNEWIKINKNKKSHLFYLDCYVDEDYLITDTIRILGEHFSSLEFNNKCVYLINNKKLVVKQKLVNNKFNIDFNIEDIHDNSNLYLKLVCQEILPDSTTTFISIYKHYVLKKKKTVEFEEQNPVIINHTIEKTFEDILIDDMQNGFLGSYSRNKI